MAFIATRRSSDRHGALALQGFDQPDAGDWGSGWNARLLAVDRIVIQLALQRLTHREIDQVLHAGTKLADLPASQRRLLRDIARAGSRVASSVVRRAPPLYTIAEPAVALACLVADDGFARSESVRWIETVGFRATQDLLLGLPGLMLVLKCRTSDPTAHMLVDHSCRPQGYGRH